MPGLTFFIHEVGNEGLLHLPPGTAQEVFIFLQLMLPVIGIVSIPVE